MEEKFFWFLAILGAIFGAFVVISGLRVAEGAPQEAVAAALGIACAVIPYCLARANSEFGRLRSIRKEQP